MEQDELKNLFSKNLNYWLLRRGKTQADLYKRMKVSSATASDWCNAKKIPRTDKLLEISNWLMIELSDLLYDKVKSENPRNDIIFRINDDSDFCELVENVSKFSPNLYEKVKEYVELLNVARSN